MKNIFLFLTLTLLVSCAKRDDADIDIRKTISNAYPDIAVDEIKKIDSIQLILLVLVNKFPNTFVSSGRFRNNQNKNMIYQSLTTCMNIIYYNI